MDRENNKGHQRDSAHRLQSIIETAIDGIITIDEKGIIESMNSAAGDIFGYKIEEVVGKNIKILMPEPDHTLHDQYLHRYLTTGKKQIIGIGREVQGRRKDGSLFPFRLAVSEVLLTGDKKIFTGIIHDLSEQKAVEAKLKEYATELEESNNKIKILNNQLEKRVNARTEALGMAIEQMEQVNKELKKEIQEKLQAEKALKESQGQLTQALENEKMLNELKSRFVSMASHEFRTPLSTILSSITLIEKYDQASQQDKRLKHIGRVKSSVHNLTSILNDFLSIEKLEKGLIEAKVETFDLPSMIHTVIGEIDHEVKKGQIIEYQHQGHNDPIKMDKHLLTNILLNLLSNAIKYSGEHKAIQVRSHLLNQHLEIEVEDQGIGIPEEEQKHLFQRFFRAKNATNIQGTGLGLNIIKKYCEIMNGDISFTSELGKGSTFSLNIPVTHSN